MERRLHAKKRKVVAEVVNTCMPPPPPPPPCHQLFTETYRPVRVEDVVGNTAAKCALMKWLQKKAARHGGVCLLSGPVGCGKTSLARAVLTLYGCDVVDLRAEGVNLKTELTDLMGTQPQQGNRLGVVIDEVENMSRETIKLLVSLLNKRASLVPIICICDDAGAKTLQAVVKACGTRVRMVTPSKKEVGMLVQRVAPQMGAQQQTQIVDSCTGDLRQATIMCQEMSRRLPRRRRTNEDGDAAASEQTTTSGVPKISATELARVQAHRDQPVGASCPDISPDDVKDLYPHNIFDATTRAMSTRHLATAETCVKYDGIMPFMLHDNLIPAPTTTTPTRQRPSKEDVEASLAELLPLQNRLELFSASDLMGSHPAHQTHGYADMVCACAVMHSRQPSFRPSFPTQHMGLGASRRRLRADLEHVHGPRTTLCSPDTYLYSCLKMVLKQPGHDNTIKKDVMKRFINCIT